MPPVAISKPRFQTASRPCVLLCAHRRAAAGAYCVRFLAEERNIANKLFKKSTETVKFTF